MKTNTNLSPLLESYVDEVKQQSTSEKQDQDMQQRLMANIENAEIAQPQVKSKSITERLKALISQLFVMPKVAKLSMFGSFALACVVTVGIMLSSSVTSPAFASVVKSLSQITSMIYQGSMQSNGKQIMQLEVYYQAPSKVRVVSTPQTGEVTHPSMINILDTQAGKGLILMQQAKVAVPFNFTPSSTVVSPDQDPLYWLDAIKQHKGKVKVLEQKWIEGLHVAGYELYVSGMTIVLWADVETNLPVQIKLQMDEVNGQSPFIFEADLQFNQPLDESLFSLQPEEGYKLGKED